MKYAPHIIRILIPFLLCSGCTSYHWLLRPGATGSVVDSQTGAAIAGAQVTLSRYPPFYKYMRQYSATALSASDGSFSFAPLEKWGIIDTVGPNDGLFYLLSVSHDGYQPYTNMFYYFSGDYPGGRYKGAAPVEFTTNFDKIQLERLPK